MEKCKAVLRRSGVAANLSTNSLVVQRVSWLSPSAKSFPRLLTFNRSVTMKTRLRPSVVPACLKKKTLDSQKQVRSLSYDVSGKVENRELRWSPVRDTTNGGRLSTSVDPMEKNTAETDPSVASSSSARSSTGQPWSVESPKILEPGPVDIMVIGSMAVNLTCTVPAVSRSSMILHTSHPAKMHASAGGVAHNVALATSYASSKSVRLVTALGSDPEGAWLREYVHNKGLDVRFISGNAETARSVAIHDKEGQLVVAAADMSIIEGFQEEDIRREIRSGKPKLVAFDGHISPDSVKAILEECGTETRGTRTLQFFLISAI
jgi:hypothetical protein